MQTNKFWFGLILTICSLWFFMDCVRVKSGGHGIFSSYLHVQNFETTSMGMIFVPFICGIVFLVYSNGKRWSWYLTWSGLAVIVIEMLSRIRFMMNVKSSYLILVILMFSVGVGLMLQSNLPTKENDAK